MVEPAPSAGDIIWISFTPLAGRKQAGKRPALVLSPRSYNDKVGLMVVCPITSNSKGYVFEVALPDGLAVSGVVLADHVKSVYWRSRGATVADRAPRAVLDHVRAKIKALLTIK